MEPQGSYFISTKYLSIIQAIGPQSIACFYLSKMAEEQKHYILEDVTIESLGLVKSGAIGETFFIIKSKDNPMNENEDIEITQEQIGKSLLASIGESTVARWVKEAVQKAAPKKKAMPMEDDMMDEEDMTEEDDEQDVEYKKRKKAKVKKENDMELTTDQIMKSDAFQEAIKKMQEQSASSLQKALDDQKELIQKQFEIDKAELEKSLNAAKSETESAKKQADEFAALAKKEKDEKDLFTFTELAKSEYAALATGADDLGKLFFDLAKWDETEIAKSVDAPKRLELVKTILKAANQTVLQSGVFNERGSAFIPKEGDLVAKAQAMVKSGEAKTIKEAMLKLSPVDQATYVAKQQKLN